MRFTALFVSSLLFAGIMPSAAGLEQPRPLSVAQGILTNTPGLCPNWNLDAFSPMATGYSWQRSGSRKIVLEWSLSPTNLEGIPVSRKFSTDEESQIRAAVTWWDSVFESIDFREVSGDYAEIKIGITAGISRATGQYWYFNRFDALSRGHIALPPASYEVSVTNGRATLDHQIRRAMPFLLGLSDFADPTAEVQSALRQLYDENSCYPVALRASWGNASGAVSAHQLAAIGSVMRINTAYAGLARIASTSLTPEVCSVPSISSTPGSGVLVNITGQGVCSVLLQAKESALPFASEVMTIRTGVAQVIINNAPPRTLKVGRKFTLRAEASSGLRVSVKSNNSRICRVQGNTITAIGVGTCRLSLAVSSSNLSQVRFLDQQKTLTFRITR